ncbi:MAG: FKBP-type peptidyl-prolyl cis-trans isomerase [Bacteroidales bacterium]|jgi:FKBP-type peptidyl-prolyl cis-trans isomerase|nr:FKBP-type peptidyl-prolyl cis-trans isomerase [Bacteroidales bacterium]
MKYNTIFLFLLFLLASCGKNYNESDAIVYNSVKTQYEKTKENKTDEAILNINKILSEKEANQIKGYIERRGWKMKIEHGVFIERLKSSTSKITINDSSVVKLEYTLSLINGKNIYSSKKNGIKKIIFGISDKEPVGLLYILKTMKNGDEANIIIPSYLAYGLYGDGKNIPRHATLVYWIKIIDVK